MHEHIYVFAQYFPISGNTKDCLNCPTKHHSPSTHPPILLGVHILMTGIPTKQQTKKVCIKTMPATIHRSNACVHLRGKIAKGLLSWECPGSILARHGLSTLFLSPSLCRDY